MIRHELVNATAKAYGATIRYHQDGLGPLILIDAPRGKIWCHSLAHGLVIVSPVGTPWQVLYQDALERMTYGLEDCEIEDCDICGEPVIF